MAVGNGEAEAAFFELRNALEAGVAAAGGWSRMLLLLPLGWRVNAAWVKRGVLLGFRLGSLVEMGSPEGPTFVDKATLSGAAVCAPADGVRVVPGGSSVRAGAFVSKGVVVMPPGLCERWGLCG